MPRQQEAGRQAGRRRVLAGWHEAGRQEAGWQDATWQEAGWQEADLQAGRRRAGSPESQRRQMAGLQEV